MLRRPCAPLPLIILGLLSSWAAFPGRSMGEGEPDKALPQPEIKPLFEDKFDATLGKAWSWLNEEPSAWRIGKEGLEIRALPGHGVQRKNRLLGPTFEAGTELSVEVFLDVHPTIPNEHAGLQCYFDEKNWVGMVYEGDAVLTLNKNGHFDWRVLPFKKSTLWLRMEISGGKASGFCRTAREDEWKKVGQWDLPSDKDFRLGLAAAGGPKDKEDWARFRDFRVLPVVKGSTEK